MNWTEQPARGTVVFDTEVYKDYFLVAFKNIVTGTTRHFECYEGRPLSQQVIHILKAWRLVSFNGRRFDMPILMLACAGHGPEVMKEAADAIIVEKLNHWDDDFKRRFPDADYYTKDYDHIDLFDVPAGRMSLKLYGGRLHSKRMQDLPIEPDQSISPEQRALLVSYCTNDLDTTIDLYRYLKPQLELRERMSNEYSFDLRSKSDAQVAEAVIKGKVRVALGGAQIEVPKIERGTVFKYQRPHFVCFDTPVLKETLAAVETADFFVQETGYLAEPPELNRDIAIGQSVYRMGIGGLHSTEKKKIHVAEGCTLVDRDVASYYPAIILQLGLYPKQMGPTFLKVYRDIVKRRLEAKARGDKTTAESLKITINGSFGKFGSKWSTLYSPDLLLQVTVTGQLCLLMLIEMLEQEGIAVVSANTDGIVIKCPNGRERDMDAVVKAWELCTGFDTEGTPYKAIYSRDVNSYIAVKPDGEAKRKGAFAEAKMVGSSWPAPENDVCVEAVVELLTKGTPVEDTIGQCNDVRKFVSVRRVAGGAVKGDAYLGKAIRWYYAEGETGAIHYKTNGNKVAKSDGARPLMDLGDGSVPADLDRGWYVREAYSILADVGYKVKELA
jgi:hypothetical protein